MTRHQRLSRHLEGIPRTPDTPPSVRQAPVFPGRGFLFDLPQCDWPVTA